MTTLREHARYEGLNADDLLGRVSRDLGRSEAIVRRLYAALKVIDSLPPGSRGAYGKFLQAQNEAKTALATLSE